MALGISDCACHPFVLTHIKSLSIAIPSLGLGRNALKLDYHSIKWPIW